MQQYVIPHYQPPRVKLAYMIDEDPSKWHDAIIANLGAEHPYLGRDQLQSARIETTKSDPAAKVMVGAVILQDKVGFVVIIRPNPDSKRVELSPFDVFFDNVKQKYYPAVQDYIIQALADPSAGDVVRNKSNTGADTRYNYTDLGRANPMPRSGTYSDFPSWQPVPLKTASDNKSGLKIPKPLVGAALGAIGANLAGIAPDLYDTFADDKKRPEKERHDAKRMAKEFAHRMFSALPKRSFVGAAGGAAVTPAMVALSEQAKKITAPAEKKASLLLGAIEKAGDPAIADGVRQRLAAHDRDLVSLARQYGDFGVKLATAYNADIKPILDKRPEEIQPACTQIYADAFGTIMIKSAGRDPTVLPDRDLQQLFQINPEECNKVKRDLQRGFFVMEGSHEKSASDLIFYAPTPSVKLARIKRADLDSAIVGVQMKTGSVVPMLRMDGVVGPYGNATLSGLVVNGNGGYFKADNQTIDELPLGQIQDPDEARALGEGLDLPIGGSGADPLDPDRARQLREAISSNVGTMGVLVYADDNNQIKSSVGIVPLEVVEYQGIPVVIASIADEWKDDAPQTPENFAVLVGDTTKSVSMIEASQEFLQEMGVQSVMEVSPRARWMPLLGPIDEELLATDQSVQQQPPPKEARDRSQLLVHFDKTASLWSITGDYRLDDLEKTAKEIAKIQVPDDFVERAYRATRQLVKDPATFANSIRTTIKNDGLAAALKNHSHELAGIGALALAGYGGWKFLQKITGGDREKRASAEWTTKDPAIVREVLSVSGLSVEKIATFMQLMNDRSRELPPVVIYNVRPAIIPDQMRVKQASLSVDQYRELQGWLDQLRPDIELIKAAAVSNSPETVDAMLGLQFLTPQNLRYFIEQIDPMMDMESILAALLVSVRLGLSTVNEKSLKDAMMGLNTVVRQMKALKVAQNEREGDD